MFCRYKQNAYLCRRIQLVNSATKVQKISETREKRQIINNKNREIMARKESKAAIVRREIELQDRIVSCMETIRKCEQELMSLRKTDLWDSGFNTRESLWLDLQRVQSGHGSYEYYLGKYGEDPCFATAALLEKQLPTLQSGLRMLGSSILAQDRCAEFCITG